jgi:hypothetical protein
MLGKPTTSSAACDVGLAQQLLVSLRTAAEWSNLICRGWGDEDEHSSWEATIKFYKAASLSASGLPRLRVDNTSKALKRNDSWFAYKVARVHRCDTPPPPDHYSADDNLHSLDDLPRNLEAEWDDFSFKTYIARVDSLCLALPKGGQGIPIRMAICTVWKPERLKTSPGQDLWQVNLHMESRQTAVPLDHGHIHKLVSMIVPPGIDRGDAQRLQVVPGQMLFSPMMISTGGAMHQLL